jgi:endonuclease/exonuclease/phosphatase family metal-dependent hydrolase
VGTCTQLHKAAEIIQRIRPDVLLINEIDFDAEKRQNADLFQTRYLAVSHHGQPPLRYPHVFFEPVNTGVPTGKDLDNDGRTDGPADAYGFGRYPGQYGMALYSAFPIDRENARSFRKLLWSSMPDNLMPDGQNGKPAWYAPEEAAVFRLSSKSHWDVPLLIGETSVHVLCAHPTPPIFDGPEDRNGRRNFDEIRLLADYIRGGDRTSYLVDDQGRVGPLPSGASFVVMGDLNADPIKDQGTYGLPAIEQLLRLERLRDPRPPHSGTPSPRRPETADYPKQTTCEFGRIDYVLPSNELKVIGAGVFWPAANDPLRRLAEEPDPPSDHRLVWVEVSVPSTSRARSDNR